MKYIIQQTALPVLVVLFLAVSTLSVFAAPVDSYKLKVFVFDPDKTGIIESKWQAQKGLPDAGKSNHALFMAKNGATTTFAAAGATVEGVEGMPVEELVSFGFDYKSDGHCGAGAPRFNIITSDGVTHFFGCTYGIHTAVPNQTGWTRVRFNFADGVPPLVPGETIVAMYIIFDEGTDTPTNGGVVTPGKVYLDNININDVLIGKPGNEK